MRSFDHLIQLFPDKTGRELLEIQNQDKLQDEQERMEAQKEIIALAAALNNNGYFKGRFSTSQYYMYHFTNVKVEEGKLYGDVEKISTFYSIGLQPSLRVGSDDINISISKKTDTPLYNYGLEGDMMTSINEAEYTRFKNAITTIVPTFFSSELETVMKEFGN
jgi:hypothetical protein